MLCSTWASGGSGGKATGIPGVAPGFASALPGLASTPLPGFDSAEAGASGGGPPRPRWAWAEEQTIAQEKANRHEEATNFEEEKNLAEFMNQILHTYPTTSRNPNKYFYILKTRR
jgi:hypothetical protein